MRRRSITTAIFAILGFMPVFLSSCNEDDLKKAAAISTSKVTFTRDRSLGVEVVYSDSAKVKAKGFAPIMDKMSPKDGKMYQEMPKGVAIDFYGDMQVKTGSISSDYAIMRDTEQITVFRKNVVVITDNMTFTTEELTWDQNKKMFFSPKGLVKRPDGSFVDAINFSAPQDFSTTTFEQGFAETYINGDFNRSLASCEGLFTGGGFEGPAEALFLKKKLLVMPMRYQYEQQCNAFALKQMGFPVIWGSTRNWLPLIQEWVAKPQDYHFDFPDHTAALIAAVVDRYAR